MMIPVWYGGPPNFVALHDYWMIPNCKSCWNKILNNNNYINTNSKATVAAVATKVVAVATEARTVNSSDTCHKHHWKQQ